MNFLRLLLAIVLLSALAACSQPSGGTAAYAPEQRVETEDDLAALLDSGAVSLVRANGNGASSGNSVEAVLRNNTGEPIEVDVFMERPVFLANSGAGQNMIGAMIVGADGSYSMSGSRSFVTISPGAQMNASLVAYCADFDKDNPTAAETFAVAAPPPKLVPVISRINEHVRANPDADVTAAAQVAVWLAQGETSDHIAKKFKFSPADEDLANSFLR